MIYGVDKLTLTLKNVVDLFDVNDKSMVVVLREATNEELFTGRVDYLQYTNKGKMHELCAETIKSLDIGKDSLLVYI